MNLPETVQLYLDNAMSEVTAHLSLEADEQSYLRSAIKLHMTTLANEVGLDVIRIMSIPDDAQVAAVLGEQTVI